MTVADLTESELIKRIQRFLSPPPEWLLVGIGDDAAVVVPERNRVEVLTVDAIVEGIHFDRRFTPPQAIGHRALAISLSDLAAMGAAPRLALMSFVLPGDLPCDDFEAMVAGLAALALRHRTHIVGGNLTRSPGPLMVDVTVLGTVKPRQVLTRGGARPGDELYLTGSIGAAAAGLERLKAATLKGSPYDEVRTSPSTCVDRYLYPEPRIRTGLLLARNRAADACVDLSDGLADAVWRMAEVSGVGAVIDGDTVPIESAARDWFAARGADPVLAAVAGGDDYELLCAVPPRLRGRLKEVARQGGAPLTRIGVCTKEPAVVLRRTEGGAAAEAPLPRGYTHFR